MGIDITIHMSKHTYRYNCRVDRVGGKVVNMPLSGTNLSDNTVFSLATGRQLARDGMQV